MNETSHAIMFHHFFDATHPKGQGALSAESFSSMVDWIASRYNLIPAAEYYEKAISARLSVEDVCLSFDDGLACQYDVAVPILEARGLGAFFFIYTSPSTGAPDLLEIFRFFRTVCFKDIDAFYSEFFKQIIDMMTPAVYDAKFQQFQKTKFLSESSFYSEMDRWFRYLRDEILSLGEYHQQMLQLMERKEFDISTASEKLWINAEQIKLLSDSGHVIGLHSHTHPTTFHKLSPDQQFTEYQLNLDHLQRILPDAEFVSMAHPCGRFNRTTIEILESIGIKIGFASTMGFASPRSLLALPRENHSNILAAMNTDTNRDPVEL